MKIVSDEDKVQKLKSDRIRKIMRRKNYYRYKALADKFLKKGMTPEDVYDTLKLIHEAIDIHGGYKYGHVAHAAIESIHFIAYEIGAQASF